MNKNKWFLNGGRGSGKTFRLLCETYENKIAELKKENAELKEALKNDKVCKCSHYFNFKDLEKQLTKAKEIIKYLLSFIQKENYKTRWDINIAEAEQFISEVKK